MEDAAADITRQAELVVMDCLKSWNCPRALDAFMDKSSAADGSAVASERFSNDMKAKTKAAKDGMSLLEYLVSSVGDQTSSSRQRSKSAKDDEAESGVEWTKEDVSALKSAIKKTSAVEEKNARWKAIAVLVGDGKTKKHCYLKYKILKEEQAAAKKKASPRHSSTSKPLEESTAFAMEDCEDMGMLLDQPTTGRAQPSRTNCSFRSPFSGGATRTPTASDVAAVQQLLFGTNKKTFSSHWEEQGFVFTTVQDLQYGLVQHQGGPCGILAVVQGYVLRFLLQHAPHVWKNPDVPHQERALVQALAHILWQAAQASRVSECVLALKDNSKAGQRKFMAGLNLHVATTEEQTRQILTTYLPQFMDSKGSGLVQFVFSVLLTKGVDTIKSEMDQLAGDSGGQLIGAHDYCTQEIVNLLLCGYARSNVFDGEQVLEGTSGPDTDTLVLHGISSQCVIGFLSLFEAYQNLVVGSYLKQPRVNIWVVCSESHYSVLFTADPRSLEDRALDTRSSVELLYYDGLSNQDEEIRLTVDTFALAENSAIASHNDLIPPLDLVIRTKWPRAAVDWNGVEPLL
ncbi:uncharacterized protein PITG_07236 [Phytophthora infestans T30-4]|uniref:Myb-like domain-containing protein n=1 Tax=Phytophthora infestans (strain T30-4) TaxID=403677 RepID=D0N7K7_PHYIT|nr:uncharacterized protein PITG_07236 [Phytophthora infestans T30-4]EEY53556.1 conserved hypothetical protein [Phytophthora infestans T30-4]|eukprot:XP_002905174.1 conserved hypothetical protein [Phytophthora infestans T30-4]